MTILEIERKSGLERTNIRFYERVGLLNPIRKENGYRDYSEADLDLLLKIKLLRRLGFSLDVIHSLIDGETALGMAIQQRIEALCDEQQQLTASQQVCHEMMDAGASFLTLDAAYYLLSYEQALSAHSVLPSAVPPEDRVEPTICPWRRFFARSFDVALIGLFSQAILAFAFHVNVSRIGNFVDWGLGLLHWGILIFAEAFFLSRFSSTLGKRILGIRVLHVNGGNLRFTDALSRTALVLVYGEGFTIPIVNLYRSFKSYKKVMDGEQLEWDTDTELIVEEMRWWRPLIYILVLACVFGFTIFASLLPAMPVNKGPELTVEEFVENYNQLMKFHGIEGRQLQPDGTFAERPTNAYTIEFDLNDLSDNEPIRLEFAAEDGILTGISFRRKVSSTLPFFYYGAQEQEIISLATMAYCWADAGVLEAAKSAELLDELAANEKGVEELELFGKEIYYSITEFSENTETMGTKFEVLFSIKSMT